RLPVFSEDRAQIIGIINVIDLLADNGMSDVVSLSRDPVCIKRELSIVEGLYALQRTQQQMAVVTDAEGESLGIVTVKDLIERIVGEVEAW
ncbi:MAG: CBS domain-containing protein, partial [Planctomycetota bacterium]